MTEDKGQWYIINVLSGFDKRVASSIREQAQKKGIDDLFEEIIVPVEGVVDIQKGRKVSTEKKVLPGYIIIKMVMNENTWHLVKNIPKVTGFLGASVKPTPIREEEVKRILKQIEEGAVSSRNVVSFEIGETVKVTDGPFESFVGVVEDVEAEKCRLKVSVSIFGRSTPIDLEYSQVAKVK